MIGGECLTLSKKIILFFAIICLFSLVAVNDAESQFSGIIFINADGSVSGTSTIQRNGNLYHLTGNIYDSPLVVLCNNIVLDGEGFVLRGAGGWGIPGLAGRETTAAINLTCTNVTVRDFNIKGWAVGILGTYNGNTISNNTITGTERAIAIYADNYNTTGNYLANSIYGVRIQGNNNRISQNQIANNYGGIMISFSLGTVITENSIANNSTAVNVDSSVFEIYHNNFINSANTTIVLTTSDAIHFGGGTMPTWDNGEEGNYWSDYTTRYPNATEIDHTGIGNIPYVVRTNPNVVDRYPLLAPANISEVIVELPSPNPSTAATPSLTPNASPTPAPPSNAATPIQTNQQTTPTHTAAASPTQTPQTQTQSLPQQAALGAGVAAAIGAVIAIVLLVKKREKQKQTSLSF
jgi:parallel beta-helix repeat protein